MDFYLYLCTIIIKQIKNKIMATKAQVVELQNRIEELQAQLKKEQVMHEEELANIKAQVEQETLHAYKEKVISFFADEIKKLIEHEIKENLQLTSDMSYGYGSDPNILDVTLTYKGWGLGNASIYQ
jgi:hypothetical protein